MNAYHLAAFPPTLLLIAVPTLWPWALAVGAFVALAAMGAAALRFRRAAREADAENVALWERVAELIAANHTLNSENTRLHLLLTEAELLAGKNPRALSLVPMQRDGAEPTWPATARQIKHDDLTALMRAVEED